MSLNLFLRPTNNAKVSYEYKTDVLSTYNNSEDRIAQRDIPRITFQYSYGITDYKSAYELENSLQNVGNAGSIFVPDWFCGIEVEDVQLGTNTIVINQFSNLAENQYVMLLSDSGATLISQISKRNDTNGICTITFNSTTAVARAYMYPLFECEVEDDTTANRINPLTNTFELEVMVKTPVFSPLLPHNVQFLGHDVFCDDLQVISGNDNKITSYQEVQENDYEIGVKDRFTFFSRMYNQFSATILSDQDRLEYTRNFIKRRWGKTFACFIPSGVADIAKHEYSTDELTDTIYVKKSGFDFESRPFIAVSHGDRITYAHVTNVTLGDVYQALTVDTETVTTVVLDAHNNVTNVITGGGLGFTNAEIDSIQSLLFARLDDDTVDFTYAGSSADNKGLYSIELSFVETDFYDSSLISYETVEGKITDKLTLFEVKTFEQALMPNDITDNNLTTTSVYTPSYIAGKYENTYAFSSVGIMDRETYPSTSSSWNYLNEYLIDSTQDFCLQIEGKFNNIEQVDTNNAVSYLARSLGVGFSIEVWNVYGSYDMYVSLSPFRDTNVGYVQNTDNIRITKYDGAITDWHEFAIQRIDGVTYVYCDGYLNGSSTVWQNNNLFRAVVISNSRKIQYLILGQGSRVYNYYSWYNTNSFTYVQQARLTVDRHVYSGTTMSKSDRVYHLNDYELTELEPMDSATIAKFDFKGISSFGRWYINYSYSNNYNMNLYSCDLAQHPYARFSPCVVDNQNDGVRYTLRNMTYKTDKLNLASADFYLPYHKYKLPVTWNKSLWMEFEFKKNGTVKDGTVILKADGIMLTAYVNADETQWSFGAFGLNPVEQGLEMFDVSDSINVVIFIDCSLQGCTAGLYINGSKYIYDDMANIITKTERGRIGFSPFYMGNINIELTKFRLVDACLTHDNTYDVDQSWKLGYKTTYFDFEFGKKQTDTYPTLRIVNIDNTYPLSSIYGVIKNEDYCLNYSFLWSDGSRSQQIVNPTPNTLYTVVVTDRTTGEQGFGWFYVYADYTGEVCRSDFDYAVEYDNDGNLIQTDYIQGVRYNFLTKAYETYNPVYLRNYLTVEDANGGGKIVCKKSNISILDFFGSDGGVTDIESSGYQWYCYHRWFLECYVKQIELVVTLKDFSTTYFRTLGTSAYYYRTTLSTLNFNGGNDYDVEAKTSTQLDYLDYYNSEGVTVEYRQHYINSTNLNKCCSTIYMYHTPKYTLNYQQGITYQGVFIGYAGSGQGYWGYSNNDLPNTCYTLFETTPPKALHIVLEPDVIMLPYGGSYSAGQIGVVIKNIWVNGKKYDMLELTKEMSITHGNLQPLPTDPNEFATYLLDSSVFKEMITQITGDYTNGIEWFNKKIGGLGGNFIIGYSTFLQGIADVHIYDYVKYEKDFDASAIIKKYS